jgi:hypothetical protein
MHDALDNPTAQWIAESDDQRHHRTDLADELWSAITENAYRGFASGLRADATAAVLVASLAYYSMVRLLIGHTPGDIDRDRYLEAWIARASRSRLRRVNHAIFVITLCCNDFRLCNPRRHSLVVAVLVVASPPMAGLVAAERCAVEPLPHAP